MGRKAFHSTTIMFPTKGEGISSENVLGTLPLMEQKEIDVILSYLKPDDIMFEWGSGGSTLYFPKFVKEYYSVESQKHWYTMVKSFVLKDKSIKQKIHIKYVPIPPYNWDTNNHTKEEFKEYIEYIGTLPVSIFNKILIDGENKTRAFCAIESLKYIDKESIVFIHDYFNRRNIYSMIEEYYDIIDKIEEGPSLVVLRKK